MAKNQTKGRWFENKTEAKKYAKTWEQERKVFRVKTKGKQGAAQYYVTAGIFPVTLRKAKTSGEIIVEPV